MRDFLVKNRLGHKELSIKYRDQVANQGGQAWQRLSLVGKSKERHFKNVNITLPSYFFLC